MKNKISPHVNIYRFPITAISSISNRISGLILTGAFLGTGSCCFFNLNLLEEYHKQSKINKKIINYLMIGSTSYHTLGGIRHIIWDRYPNLLNNKQVAQSSYYLFGSSLLISYFFEKHYSKLDTNDY